MKKEITKLKKDYIHALTKSQTYLSSGKTMKSQKQFVKGSTIFNDLCDCGKEGETFIKEIAIGENYPLAIISSMLLLDFDKEKATFYLKRIIKKKIAGYSFFAQQVLEQDRGSREKC